MTVTSTSAGVILRSAIAESIIQEEEVPESILTSIQGDQYNPPIISKEKCQMFLVTDESVKAVFSNGMEKLLSWNDFMKVISSAVTDSETTLAGTSFNLPSNVFFFHAASSEIRLSAYYPEAVSKLKFANGMSGKLEEFDIVMPNLIISHVLKPGPGKGTWKVVTSKYFCTDLPVNKLPKTFINSISHRDRIYLMPMSNTYSEGNMCYGGNSMPINMSENNLRALDWYYQFLWASPFNSDLGIRALATGGNDVSTWYATLKKHAEKKEPFPYKRLSGWTAL